MCVYSFLFRLFRFFVASTSFNHFCLLCFFSLHFSPHPSLSSLSLILSLILSLFLGFLILFFRIFRFFVFSASSLLPFLLLLLPPFAPSDFFCSFHLFLSLLSKSPVNLRMFVSTSRLSLGIFIHYAK